MCQNSPLFLSSSFVSAPRRKEARQAPLASPPAPSSGAQRHLAGLGGALAAPGVGGGGSDESLIAFPQGGFFDLENSPGGGLEHMTSREASRSQIGSGREGGQRWEKGKAAKLCRRTEASLWQGGATDATVCVKAEERQTGKPGQRRRRRRGEHRKTGSGGAAAAGRPARGSVWTGEGGK